MRQIHKVGQNRNIVMFINIRKQKNDSRWSILLELVVDDSHA